MRRPADWLEGPVARGSRAPGDRALREAAEWRVRLAEAPLPASENRAFERWLAADTAHGAAWREIERTWAAFDAASRPGARAALDRSREAERRELRRLLGKAGGLLLLLLALLPAGWMGLGLSSPAHLLADHRTTIGERRILTLADGSRLTLDTATAVDVRFTAGRRQIRLIDGRVFIDVAPDAGRPLQVVTEEARTTALGTRFSVRRLREADAEATRVTVHESRVELCATGGDACRRLDAGQRAQAAGGEVDAMMVVPIGSTPNWIDGVLEIDGRSAAEVLAELGRYHRGVLRYDASSLADLEVSGVLPLDDTERALNALAATLPIRVRHYTPWVISVTRLPR